MVYLKVALSLNQHCQLVIFPRSRLSLVMKSSLTASSFQSASQRGSVSSLAASVKAAASFSDPLRSAYNIDCYLQQSLSVCCHPHARQSFHLCMPMTYQRWVKLHRTSMFSSQQHKLHVQNAQFLPYSSDVPKRSLLDVETYWSIDQ